MASIPAVLHRIVGNLPDDYPKPADLTVLSVGAPVTADLRAAVTERLASVLMDNYGTTEAATICDMKADGFGRVVPGATVEVVNDRDEPVYGEAGRVRYTSGACVPGYIDDDEATRRMFGYGWFYPGDEGVLVDRHTLHLIGRADNIVNVRGYKILPQPLEERLLAALPIDDVCVTALPDANGDVQLCVAVVMAGESRDGVLEKLRPMMPALYGPIRLMAVEVIPRTATGKIKRNDFHAALLRRHAD